MGIVYKAKEFNLVHSISLDSVSSRVGIATNEEGEAGGLGEADEEGAEDGAKEEGR